MGLLTTNPKHIGGIQEAPIDKKQEKEGTKKLTRPHLESNPLKYSGHHSFRPNLSGHLSFRSSVPVLRAKGENSFWSVKSSSENIHRRQFFRRRFFLHRKERLEEISNFSQSTGARKPSTRRPSAFFRPATASHALAREGA